VRLGPIVISNFSWWRFMYTTNNYCGLFRNRDGVLPGRWGFYVLGFEFGSRNPGNRFGVLLKRLGLWPW
jgi:hypothetical protein